MFPTETTARQLAELRRHFVQRYGGVPRFFRAPGRINLIGEHTDYNDGFVLPAAIDFAVWAAIAPRNDGRIRAFSTNFGEEAEFSLARGQERQGRWSDFVEGPVWILQRCGYALRGADLLICGDVPIGAGLSSSAAIQVVVALALLTNSGLTVERSKLAELCRRAENEFVGARVGIMDPFVSCFGREGQALELDCRSLDCRWLSIPERAGLVICNSGVKHENAASQYNNRRSECEEGVSLLSDYLPGIRALRDVSRLDLESYGDRLPETIYRRCRHVISENARVKDASAALEREDLESFGRLMGESHRSLRDDYQVSCPELDLLVELSESTAGVFGARMTGGGFGGCTINLVDRDAVSQFERLIAPVYEKRTGRAAQIWVVSASAAAGEVQC